jgi:ABC-type uncharacterized transport system auxiliary subunit
VRPRPRGLLRAAAAGLLLAGCVAGPSPRDRFFRLAVPPPQARLAAPALAGTLEVERPSSTALARERAILSVAGGDAVEVVPHAYELWVDSPTLLVQRTLVAYLDAAGLAQQVVTPDAGASERWTVAGHLERLEHVTGGAPRVLVELELRLAPARGEPLLQKTYRAERGVDGADVEEAVRGFGAALGEIYAGFAADAAAAAR